MRNSSIKGRRRRRMSMCATMAAILLSVSGVLLFTQTVSPTYVEALDLSALQDEPPVADAGPPYRNVTSGKFAVLNGSNSTGFEGPEALNYTWVIVVQGAESVYFGMNVSVQLNYTGLGSRGLANVTLIVRDSLGRMDIENVIIYINEPPPSWFEKYGVTAILLAILCVIGVPVLFKIMKRAVRREPIIYETEQEKAKVNILRYWKLTRDVGRMPMGLIGLAILMVFVFLAAFGPVLAPYSISLEDADTRYLTPSSKHWLGTDNFGFDIFSELLVGARTSMIVGLVSALIASVLGALVGLYSGYAGGWKDEVVMRLNDVVLSIPWLVLMIIVAAFIGKIDLTGLVLIIGLTGWSYTARMVRAQVLSVKERQYVERSRAIGASEMNVIRRHIFPNTFPLIFANTILTVAVSILSESTLSFLGMRPVNEVTWGTMLSYAEESSAFERELAVWIMAPGLCIVIVVLGFTLLGYALDEILNPKLRHR